MSLHPFIYGVMLGWIAGIWITYLTRQWWMK